MTFSGCCAGRLCGRFEASYVESRGYTVSQDWGDSQELTKELAFARDTRTSVEEVLTSRGNLLVRLTSGLRGFILSKLMKLESIFHPSDFSAASEVAFAHALKIALVAKTRLSVLHVSAGPNVEWQDFPGVRTALERWNLIPKGSPKSAVADLGIGVEKVVLGGDPVKACLGYLERHRTDLIVLAVHQYEGRMQWLRKSVGQPIAEGSGEMTLFIPHGVDGFVSLQDGSVSLRNILIPITTKPRPQPAVEAALRLIRNLQLSSGTVTLLHAGPASDSPSVRIPDDTGWTWNHLAQEGEPTEVILTTAAAIDADLIVMTTDGPEGFLDGLRGTTSERVLRKTRCPIVNLPVGSLLA